MRYMSTRGQVRDLSFKDAVMMGLANDGGLLLPKQIPAIDTTQLAAYQTMSYPQIAFDIISRFTGDDFDQNDLRELIERSYATFDHPDVTPVTKQDGVYILELFHGPTLAFKDVALQFLGNLFEYLLEERNEKMNILGATSGDTGSAAIYGVRGKDRINIFIMHPDGKVSPIQKLQMTTVTDENVFNLAIRGTFDDGQRIVKETFNDLDFKANYSLGAVNSINWARVLAQIVYYFYAYSRVQPETGCEKIDFSVPTGNFGDIFAGYMAKRMGLPVDKLILATNENNILSRFVLNGDYSVGDVVETLSPSMDIQIASNFERYLYYLLGEDSESLCGLMESFATSKSLQFDGQLQAKVREDFDSLTVDKAATVDQIRDFHQRTGYVLDPHTAVGVRAGERLSDPDVPVVCLATAHPAKFGDAVQQAIGQDPERPASLDGIEQRDSRCELIDAETEKVKAYLAQRAR
ncbi:threonine synthase [Desulfuromonas acetoxidans]|uniref:Threonine synthase n=1 Tax=Desulfuromonas acetoxidans (strain DSM 684 / 11070) TaxID=281689 RepID=Q1K0E7_DESA6|nr:threonine synthase [Desulfuromonas acetoxidans]EAT15994.1 threonine synthase [Desulfuromonas acetoxidans DSM 684]MBF0644108.1 threonine synthase [Desulfuromonas acetoxidans]NVD24594.1 threonine synthase [Desulfuromonas acetoxidans]NVE16456.1 threonine synthase [Desulfuromonas acetoxidans]